MSGATTTIVSCLRGQYTLRCSSVWKPTELKLEISCEGERVSSERFPAHRMRPEVSYIVRDTIRDRGD